MSAANFVALEQALGSLVNSIMLQINLHCRKYELGPTLRAFKSHVLQ
jgi:hypothetical protein